MLSMLIRVLLVDGIVLRVILPCKYVHPEIVREGRGIESQMEPPRGGEGKGVEIMYTGPLLALFMFLYNILKMRIH